LHEQKGDEKMKYAILISMIAIACSPATVQICDGNSCGTGWVMDQNTLLTAAHVVKNENVKVYVPKNNYLGSYTFEAPVIFYDWENDVAFIRTKNRIGKPLKPCQPVIGETIKVYGQDGSGPTRSARTIRKCTVKSLSEDSGILDCGLENKMSGAPVMSVKRKCVVGYAVKSGNDFSVFISF
jgi:hypothetical protein